jgi:hypothetical protein
MKLKVIQTELDREHKTRKSVYPRWISAKKIHPYTAKTRLEAIELASAIFNSLSEREFDALCRRLELNPEPYKQGSLFDQ